MSGEGNKLTKKAYKFAAAIEKRRLINKLVFLSFVSLCIAGVLFMSMYFDIKDGEY